MSTPISALVPYCSPAQLIQLYDARQIGDCVGDVGVRLTPSQILNDPNTAAILLTSAGEIESACLVAGKYSVADLQGLIGASQQLLVYLNATLAFWKILTRRYPLTPPTEWYKLAMEQLERLRLGERIFGLQEVANAGLPLVQFLTPSEINFLNLNTTQARRFFGCRGKDNRASRAFFG